MKQNESDIVFSTMTLQNDYLALNNNSLVVRTAVRPLRWLLSYKQGLVCLNEIGTNGKATDSEPEKNASHDMLSKILTIMESENCDREILNFLNTYGFLVASTTSKNKTNDYLLSDVKAIFTFFYDLIILQDLCFDKVGLTMEHYHRILHHTLSLLWTGPIDLGQRYANRAEKDNVSTMSHMNVFHVDAPPMFDEVVDFLDGTPDSDGNLPLESDSTLFLVDALARCGLKLEKGKTYNPEMFSGLTLSGLEQLELKQIALYLVTTYTNNFSAQFPTVFHRSVTSKGRIATTLESSAPQNIAYAIGLAIQYFDPEKYHHIRCKYCGNYMRVSRTNSTKAFCCHSHAQQFANDLQKSSISVHPRE